MLLALHTLSTLSLLGLIWFVQLVHYPLFGMVDEVGFRSLAYEHQRRTTWIVAPLMLVEATTATLLVVKAPDGLWLSLSGWLLLVVIWAATAFVQVPLHRRLMNGRDSAAIRSLVRSNWIRTVAWSCRSILALALLGFEAQP